jgi:hypothetical protein
MFFLLSFVFSLTKSETRRAEQVLARGRGRGGTRGGKGVYTYIHMYINAKMIPVETVPGIQRGEMKESGQGVN